VLGESRLVLRAMRVFTPEEPPRGFGVAAPPMAQLRRIIDPNVLAGDPPSRGSQIRITNSGENTP